MNITERLAALPRIPNPFCRRDRERFESAPCFVCGYNGPGYFQTESHPCAARYHDSNVFYDLSRAVASEARLALAVELLRGAMAGLVPSNNRDIDAFLAYLDKERA